MNLEARKKKFVTLLQELLTSKCDGVQARLAERIQIGTSTISRWLSGQVDPINVETLIFSRIAMLKGCSTQELAKSLDFIKAERDSQKKFQILLKQMLSDKTQEQLGELIGVSQIAISNWLNPEKNIDPAKIPAGTMFAIADQLGWTFDNLLAYLGFQVETKIPQKFLIKYQLELSELSLAERQELLAWLLNSMNIKINNPDSIKEIISTSSDRKVCIILEFEDLAIASNYANNLGIHFQIKAENITIATPRSLPDSLSIFDVLLFDLNNQQSPCIPLIDSLQFDGDVVAFVDRSLPEDIQDRLKQKVSEVIVKPVPWSELKRQAYFE
ncbi:MAG: helix-turn-helix transcriptional regulator [Prochloraceae cyanobacterium]|nr:helix-turn-helix transcriptional regulator [Prochloraceae cyanobacterium]